MLNGQLSGSICLRSLPKTKHDFITLRAKEQNQSISSPTIIFALIQAYHSKMLFFIQNLKVPFPPTHNNFIDSPTNAVSPLRQKTFFLIISTNLVRQFFLLVLDISQHKQGKAGRRVAMEGKAIMGHSKVRRVAHLVKLSLGPAFSVTSKNGLRQLKQPCPLSTKATFSFISSRSASFCGSEQRRLRSSTLLLMILTTRSSFSLKNSCRNIYKLLSQPNRSYGRSFSNFLRRSRTVLLKDFFQKLMDLLFISEMVSGVTPSQGLLPTSSSQKSRPRQQRSTLLLQPSLRMTSGARYSQLPQSSFIFSPGSILTVNPKSHILTSPFSLSSTFSGLRSRQTRPFSCRLTTPKATCIQIMYFSVRVRRALSSAFRLLRITPQRSPCTQYSTTKQTQRASSNWQYSFTLYLLGNYSTSYSELIIIKEPFQRHSALFMRFMQNTRRSHRRSTSKISAQVPSPILRRIVKCPSVTDSAWQSSDQSGSGCTTSRLRGRRTSRFSRPGSSAGTWSSSKQSSQSLARRTSMQKLRGLAVRTLHSCSCGESLPVATRCFMMEVREREASWVTLTGVLSLGISSLTLKQGFSSVNCIRFEYITVRINGIALMISYRNHQTRSFSPLGMLVRSRIEKIETELFICLI